MSSENRTSVTNSLNEHCLALWHSLHLLWNPLCLHVYFLLSFAILATAALCAPPSSPMLMDKPEKRPFLLQALKNQFRTIIFTRTKHGADQLVKYLLKQGVTASAIHGNKSQNARQRTLDAFRKGEEHILIATDIAARGIDIPEVSLVVNYDVPTTPEAYVHRIGRTGRAGREGEALSLVCVDEHGLLPVVTTAAEGGEVLMLGYRNEEALKRTIATGEAHYFSRSREVLWHKGATSGLVQRVVELRIAADQDAVWLRVEVAGSGASCHVGYRSCFFREVPVGVPEDGGRVVLQSRAAEKTFDPVAVYGDAPNPTKL